MGKPEILDKLKNIVSGVESFGSGEETEGIAYLVVDSLLATMGGVESFVDEDHNPPSVMLNSRAAIVAAELISLPSLDTLNTATVAAAIAAAAAAKSGKSSAMSAAAAASALAGEGTAHMPRLFSFLSADNQGIEAYFHAQFFGC
ncbi:hypothetical protein NC653_032675 [Populus alba x Populus x berolinensis]|uniref:Uncharacterized protein n=1 Tax=Populus alba x Populus x berolinensis TaxID=444605 RepID=A0AAD6LRW0_9ROSI|nr:hypothetical protein NC653_032675 [Populus alba x Populus x berolinensis]